MTSRASSHSHPLPTDSPEPLILIEQRHSLIPADPGIQVLQRLASRALDRCFRGADDEDTEGLG